MEGVMFQLGCWKIWSRHANCGWKTLKSLQFCKDETSYFDHSLWHVVRSASAHRDVDLQHKASRTRGSLCVLWMQLGDEVDLKRFLVFQLRFKQTCSEQQEEHGGRRGA